MNNKELERTKVNILKWAVFLFCGFLIAFLYPCFEWIIKNEDIPIPLVHGYYWGGIASGLFAGAAFLGVIYSFKYQKKQAILQKKDSDEAFKSQKEYYQTQLDIANRNFNQQNKTDEIKRFESTFFNMLSLHQEIVNELSFSYSEVENIIWNRTTEKHTDKYDLYNRKYIKGRYLFEYLFDVWPYEDSTETNKKPLTGMKGVLSNYGLDAYEEKFYPTSFDHYFRHLYSIIKFVHQIDFFTFEEKYKYTSMVRSTLSRYELIWIFYNGISKIGSDKFKPLIEEYSLLKNIRDILLPVSKGINKCLDSDQIGNFPKNDYEYYIHTGIKTHNEYYISAFFNKKDLPKAIEKFNERKSKF